MAPYHGHENQQGMPSKQSSKSGDLLSVSRNSHNVGKPASGGGPPYRRDWQTVGAAMQAPTVRVIHIFAPKVIQTDVANFRSTVQRLTGRSKKSGSGSQRRARSKAVSELVANQRDRSSVVTLMPSSQAAGAASFTGLWEEGSENEVLQRLVVDACGTDHLVRCNSVESSLSLDSGNFSGDSNLSNDTDLPSPTDSFSFYPQRETPYSLSEIPAPFFDDMHPCYNVAPTSHAAVAIPEHALHLPSVIMDNHMSMLSFDVDNISSGLGSSLPLSDMPFPSLGFSTSGGLYDLIPQHCRLSVQQPFQGANIFEPI